MADTTNFRNGFTMLINGALWQIVKFQHVKPGKGGAFVRTTLKNIKSGKVVDRTFRAGEKVSEARVERREHQFLYEDSLGLHFMSLSDYSQTTLPRHQVPLREYLKDGGMIDILFHADTESVLLAELPRSVELEVVKSDPGLRGDTATGATKPATLESGAVVNVPLFINEGDMVRVNTATGDYITRIST